MIKERLISDNFTSHETINPSLDTQTSQTNIKSEILDDPPQTPDPLDCPISIILAGQSTTTSQHHNPITPDLTIKPSDTPTAETRRKVEGDKLVDFPIFEIVDSSDDNATVEETQPEETINTGNDFKLRRSSRNVGPTHFYGKRFYKDIIDETDYKLGSARNPIPLVDNNRSGLTSGNINRNPTDKQTPIFSIQSVENTACLITSSLSDPLSLSSTDQSLRDAVNSFDDFIDFDNENFDAELEKFMEGNKPNN